MAILIYLHVVVDGYVCSIGDQPHRKFELFVRNLRLCVATNGRSSITIRRFTALRSIFFAVIAIIVLSSCGQNLIPPEVSGLGNALKGAASSLEGIADVADPVAAVNKAKEALPHLMETATQLASVGVLMAELPGPAKNMVAQVVDQFRSQIKELVDKVSAISWD